MRNDFLNELKSVAMESVGANLTVDPYAGSEVAEELITLDILDANAVAMESYTEALFAETFEAQEIALESVDLSFAEIAKFNGELGMEAIMNAVKRGAYGAQIQAKKIAQKIMKFVMAIINYFAVADGKFKSYNKLLKKYKEKLSKVNPAAATGDKDEKEYTIRDWSNLHSQYESFVNEANTTQLNNLLTACAGTDLTSIKTNLTQLAKTGSSLANVTDSSSADTAIEEWKSKLKEEIAEIKEGLKDIDTKDGTFQELKDNIQDWLTQAISDTSKDIKFKKDISKLRTKMNKIAGKKTDNMRDDEARVIQTLNKIATPILTGVQKKATLRYRKLTSGYQGLLSDAAKLISGGTRVND